MNHSKLGVLFFSFVFVATFLPFNASNFALAFFILYSFYSIKQYPKAYINQLMIPFSILFVMFSLPVMYQELSEQFKTRLSVKLGLILFPVAVYVVSKRIDFEDRFTLVKRWIQINTLSYFLFLTVAVVQILISKSLYRYFSNGDVEVSYLLYSGFSDWQIHPAYLSLMIGASLIFIIQEGNKLFSSKEKFFHLIIHVIFLFQLQGRMNLLALMLLLAIMLSISLLQKVSTKKAVVKVVSSLAVIILIWNVLPNKIKGRFAEPLHLTYDITSPTFDGFNGFTIRLAEWECALHAISKAPILGHGIGQSKEVLHQSFEEKGFEYGLKRGYNAHNQFLEVALSSGMVGASIFLFVFVYLLRLTYLSNNMAAFYVILYTALCFLTESYLERQKGVHFFAFIIPMLLLNPVNREEVNDMPTQ